MKLTHLETRLAVSPQLHAEDIEAIAGQGYVAIINNRPDGEKGEYLTAAEAERVAKSHGLEYRHIPVTPEALTDEAVEAFKLALDGLAGPIVAHCGTGRRSSAMWALSQARDSGIDSVLAQCACAGHDLSPLRPRLAQILKMA